MYIRTMYTRLYLSFRFVKSNTVYWYSQTCNAARDENGFSFVSMRFE